MGWISIDPQLAMYIWLGILITWCMILAAKPVRCKGCHGCRKPCGNTKRGRR